MPSGAPGGQGTDSLFDVAFLEEVGWTAGEHGTILTTTDGGGSWSGAAERHSSAYLRPGLRGPGHGDGRSEQTAVVLHTNDGGQSWTKQNSGTREELLSVDFANDKRGWAVGRGGTVIRTDRGGKPWKTEEVGTRHDLHDIHVANGTTAFVAGDLGLLLEYHGRPDIPIGVNLWVLALVVLVAAATIYLWRRYFAKPFRRRPGAVASTSWRSGWAAESGSEQ